MYLQKKTGTQNPSIDNEENSTKNKKNSEKNVKHVGFYSMLVNQALTEVFEIEQITLEVKSMALLRK